MTPKGLLPVPKVLIPALVIWIGLGATFIATGDFDRTQASIGFSALAYAVIGYVTPTTYTKVKNLDLSLPKPKKPKRRARK